MVEELGISPDRLKELTSPEEYLQALELGPSDGGVGAVVDEMSYVELFLATQCRFQVVGSDFTRSGWGFVSFFSLSCSYHSITIIIILTRYPVSSLASLKPTFKPNLCCLKWVFG